jgi:protease-4
MLVLRRCAFVAFTAMTAAACLPSRSATAADSKTSSTPTVAVFTLDSLSETPTPEDPIFGAVGGESLVGMVRRLDKAAKDENVKAVVVLSSGGALGRGQVEEVRQAMARVKAAGKPIYAHADSLSTGTYTLLSGASRLSVSPTGDVFLTGIYGEQVFLKGLFDKLDIHADFLTCGAYKSAAEMFTRSEPSAEAKEMTTWLYDGIFDSMLNLIAEGRSVSSEKARGWIDQGLFSAESAKTDGLIDAVEHRQDFQAFIAAEHGDKIKLDRSYGRSKGQEIDLNNPFAALSLWAQILNGPQEKKSNKDAIAIVYVDGPIMLGSGDSSPLGSLSGEGAAFSEPIRKALDDAARDEKVKAVVLRVNSPGGSAIASEIILNATKRVKDKKPLVVSMGDVAGSGGYYVACASDVIFADHATITGSIGVVAGKLATNAAWERFGINFEPVARGKRAAILSGGQKFTEEERKELQGWMDEVYGVFKGHVTAIRGEKLKKPIDDLAGGRVYTGAQALDLGLVDKIGTLSDALAFAADQAKVDDYDLRVLPKPSNFLEQLLGEIPGQKKDEQWLSLPGVSGAGVPEMAIPLIRQLEPARARLLIGALTQLRVLQQERLSLTMPIMDVRN